MDEVFWAGYDAHQNDMNWAENPYKPGTWEHGEWEEGWDFGEKEAAITDGVANPPEPEPYGDELPSDPKPRQRPRPIKLISTDNIAPNLRLFGAITAGILKGVYYAGKGAWFGIKKLFKQ